MLMEALRIVAWIVGAVIAVYAVWFLWLLWMTRHLRRDGSLDEIASMYTGKRPDP
jgi:uncharacterized membrane protein YccC